MGEGMSGGIVGVLLAAGAGTRLGGAVPKPLVPFRGRPLASWPLAALRAGGLEEVVVVLGAEADAVAGGMELGGDAEVVRCDEWAEGLSASLRAGVQAAAGRGAAAVVIVLADQPLLSGEAVARVVAARAPGEADAIRATYAGVPGHPTVLESSTFAAVAGLRGDAGARELLRDPSTRVHLVPCEGLGRPDDVDTPEMLARLQAAR
ncbi:MAG TPA: nucleotidyltransferase family protein [Baekduia sp.]|nr:nucleotidyltransferase family protein [Baekduia sp.]